MMNSKLFLYVCICCTLFSCSVQRYIPPGEKLYRGYDIKVEKHPETKTKSRALRNELRLAVKPRPNKFLLGQPWKVWWWYKIGEPKRERGLKAFLRNKLGEPPVLSSRINAVVTAENMTGLMENLGYFHTTAQGDTTNSGYFTKAHYKVQVQPRYFIRNVKWVNDSSALMNILQSAQERRSLVKAGNGYRLSDITAERERIDLYIKTRGYYYFNPDYLMVYADSTVGDRKVDMYFNIKNTTPDAAKHPYTINAITVFPNYNLALEKIDTTRDNLTEYDGVYIKDTVHKFKPDLFARTITYRPGSIYSSREQNVSLNRIISISAFKFVKNRFEPLADTSHGHLMNAYYFITPATKKSIQAEISGFSKDNNYIGAQLGVNMKNRNVFKGGELLTIRAFGGFEVSVADSLQRNNNFRLGGEANLKIPRYVIPFIRIKENNFYPPNTNMILGYELLRKQLFYTRNVFRAQYEFTWKKNLVKQYTWAPFAVSYLKATSVTDSFYKQAAISPSLLLNVFDEAILGSIFTFTYNSTRAGKNKFYFNASLDVSGNLAGAITGAKSWREKTVFGTPFAQYVKTDFDLHYTRSLSNKWSWANRFQLGIGMPYNNSIQLPFTKQYIIGGSNSIRGFTVRNVGPGAYKPTAEDQRFFQIIGGDYKLLFNTELRIPITGIIHGAVFTDIGNIWTKDTLLFGKLGQLKKDWFKEIAVASGIGLRFDATVILIRIDLGIPLRKPFLPDGQRWVLNQVDFSSSAWRKENMILNIAIGYPF